MGILDILKEIPLSAVLKERLTEQDKRMSALEAENKILKTENAVLKGQSITSQSQDLDACPYCNQLAGILQERKRHELFGEAGVFTHFYQCSNCQKTYEKDKRT